MGQRFVRAFAARWVARRVSRRVLEVLFFGTATAGSLGNFDGDAPLCRQ